MDDILHKLKKVVRIVLYGPAISQSDCRKTGPYQLPCNNMLLGPYGKIFGPLFVRSVRKAKVQIFSSIDRTNWSIRALL